MIKKIALVGGIIGAIVLLFLALAQKPHPAVVYTGNIHRQPVSIAPNAYQCTECKMPLQSARHAAEVVLPNGKTWFFDDIGCMALWLKDQPFSSKATIWVYTNDTLRWIEAHKARYSRFDSTPMGYGFGAYEHDGKGRVAFATMMRDMAAGRHLANPDYTRLLRNSNRNGHKQ